MDAQGWRQLLEAERARLVQLRHGLEAELTLEPDTEGAAELSVLDQHQADVASELFEREKGLSILARIDTELGDVVLAMARLDQGTFGRCQTCGTSIPEERLTAVPATRFCLEHEAQREISQANAVPDAAPLADDVAAREGARHLGFLPTDDDPEERLELGPEEWALHLTGSVAGSHEGPMTAGEVEWAEERQSEVDDRARAVAATEASRQRSDAEGVALEEEQLDAGR